MVLFSKNDKELCFNQQRHITTRRSKIFSLCFAFLGYTISSMDYMEGWLEVYHDQHGPSPSIFFCLFWDLYQFVISRAPLVISIIYLSTVSLILNTELQFSTILCRKNDHTYLTLIIFSLLFPWIEHNHVVLLIKNYFFPLYLLQIIVFGCWYWLLVVLEFLKDVKPKPTQVTKLPSNMAI